MRKLVWFAVGFVAAAVIFAYFLSGPFLLIALLSAAASLSIALCRWRKLFPAALVLLGLAVGMLYCRGYDRLLLSELKQCDGTTVYLTVEASDYSFDTGYGNAFDGTVTLNGKSIPVRLYYSGGAFVQPGDTVKTDALIRYTPAGGLKKTTYHKGDGIFLLCYAKNDLTVFSAEKSSARYVPAYLRRSIAERLDTIFPGESRGFAKALLLGDDSDLNYGDDVALQKSGIRHVIAVSGLHVSILMTLLYWVTGKRRLLTFLLGAPLLLLFAAVAGFTPSVVRACLMQMFMLVAVVVNREYDPPTAIGFSAVAMLLINPLVITSVSFQLSFGCMVGLFGFSVPIQYYLMDNTRLGKIANKPWKKKLVRWLCGSVSISVGTMIVTIPLCALYFQSVSLIGIVTNLITLWAVSVLFCGVIAACLLSVIWLPLGTAVATALSVLIRFVLVTARVLSQVPFGVAYTHSIYTVIWLVVTYLLIGVFFLAKKKKPLIVTVCVLVLYCLSMFATWLEPRLDKVRMTVVDVGQGQCVILQSGEKAYMIDCGGQDPRQTATTAINWLNAQGIYRLDGLVLTHFDSDHANGVTNLTQIIPVDMLYLPDAEPENPIRRALSAPEYPVTWVNGSISIPCNSGVIRLFPAEKGTEGNESSMCILFQGENCDILITGDRDMTGEHHLLTEYALPDIEVLVAGHHGADTSTGYELLQFAAPEIVIISAGQDNLNGHPHRQTISRLEKIGCIIRRTDLEGTIIIRG